MAEGRTYLCTWKRTESGFDAWVKARPKLRGSAESFEAADEALYEAILAALGDGENSREYTPPRPDAIESDGLLYRLKHVTGNGRAMIANDDMPGLWTRGVCTDCRKARGKRTNAPIVLQSADSENGLSARAQHPFNYPGFDLYSADFVALLTPAERRRFTWRAVERVRGSKPYLEIVASRTALPLAAFKEEYVGHDLYVCPTCGYKSEPSYSFVPPTPSLYVSERDVPRRLPSCFTVGRQLALCFTAERWAELVERKAARGLVSSDVGVVDSRLVDRRPKRKTLDVTDQWST
jgi:hypothetical protein